MNLMKYIPFLIMVSVCGKLFSQESITLNECLRLALEKNYSIKIIKNEEQKSNNNVNYSQFIPSVNATGSQRENIYSYSEEKNTSDIYAAGVVLDWTLFDGMAMFADHNKYLNMRSIGELNTKMAIENIIVSVSELYYSVIVEQSKLDAARHSLSLSNDRFNEARDKYNLGVLSGLEMQQAKIDFNADSSSFMRQKEYLKSAYISLNLAMCGDLQNTGYVNDTIALTEPLSFEILETNTLNFNTALLIAKKQMKISELDLQIARSSLYPTIKLNAGYNYNRTESVANANAFNKYHGPYWGFSVNVPLFSRLETVRKIKNSKIDSKNAAYSYEDASLQIQGDLAQLYNTYENNLKIVDFENESANVAYENLDAALEKYKIGSLSGIEFREFQRSYIDAVNRKLSAIYQAKVSELSLLLISGGIRVQ
ncbi:MAG: TolC family protein [Bacteroidales bacterium]|nr:TolC family protein [Bacteroidales bacterium]